MDVLAVCATLFGLATFLGYGAEQSAGGLHFLFGLPEGETMKITIIVVITIMALVSILAPPFIFIVWMTVFGHAAMDQYFVDGYGGVVDTVKNFQPELSLFMFLAEYPLATLTSAVGIVLVLVFFVTSIDSGALVVDTMTAGGKIDAPIAQRVFWCCFLGLIGVALMEGGGLASLQALALATGFPFGIVILMMCVSLYKGLAAELAEASGVAVDSRVDVVGDPAADLDKTLDRQFHELGVGLVVMASHVPGFREYIFHSNAGFLASHTDLSVFVVRG